MKILSRWALLAFLPLTLEAAQPWQQITTPTIAEAAAAFPKPPHEYGAISWAIWGGQQTKEGILADIEKLDANGAGVYMIDNSGGLKPKYFTPEYLDLVKFAIDECKKRGIKVWIEGDAGYPDGFAGGMISKDYPQLGMQGIVADAHYTVAAGQTLRIPVPPDTLGILAFNRPLRMCAPLPIPADGQFQWTAPDPGTSEIVFVRHVYRSSPTRYTNRADGTADKDSLYSEIDYLDPNATNTYLKLIFDTYDKLVGSDFGSTILGLRGDETDYTGIMPWTPQLLEKFKEIKGYDLQPYIPQFFEPEFSPEVRRAKADYWDVWSALFRDNFYKVLNDWCEAHGMEYMSHLNHEETMLDLAHEGDMTRNEGSFFRDMQDVDVPGIDNLNQIGPGLVADFPKIASDAAHVYGHPHVWAEEGGGPGQAGKFVADYQLVRGVNYLNVRGLGADRRFFDSGAPAASAAPLLNSASAIGWYVTRAGYLLTIGRPAAQVALYHPDDSLWLGDAEADRVQLRLTTELMERQIDFDAVNLDGILSSCTLDGSGLRNMSGQVYKAVIVPTCSVINRQMLDKLRAFAAAGGKVVFVGRTPSMVIDRTFLNPEPGAPDLSFATLEPQAHITDAVVAALPAPDVALDLASPPIKYIHRSLGDGEVYFFFNESDTVQSRTATLVGTGQAQVWDATTGLIHPLAGVQSSGGHVAVPLVLEPQETRFIVIGSLPPGVADPAPLIAGSQTVADLDGDWSLALGDKMFTGPLQTWEKLGVKAFPGTALYKKDFDVPAALPTGQRVFLDLGSVHEVAHVRVNGQEFDARPWPPYIWDVTAAIKPGANTLEVEVQTPPHEIRRGFGGRRRNETGPVADTGPKGFSPTGVPSGLTWTDSGAYRASMTPSGFFVTAPDVPPTSGLLGPVRLFSQ
jgi:hypothetical protein